MMASTHTAISTSLSTSTSTSENMVKNSGETMTGSQQTPLELPFAYSMPSVISSDESKLMNGNYATNVNINDFNERDVLSSSSSSSFIPPAHEKSLEYHFNPDHYKYTRPADKIQNENSSEKVHSEIKYEEEDFCSLDHPQRNHYHQTMQENYGQNRSVIENIRPTINSITFNNTTPSPISIMPPDTYRYGPDLLSHLLDPGTNFFTKSFDPNSDTRGEQSTLLSNCETAKKAAKEASFFLKKGELDKALIKHAVAAKAYRDIALAVQDYDTSLCDSLLLLSQAQARNGNSLLELHQNNTIHINTFRDTKNGKDSENISTTLSTSKSSNNNQMFNDHNEHIKFTPKTAFTKNMDIRNNDTSTDLEKLTIRNNSSEQKKDELFKSNENSTNPISLISKGSNLVESSPLPVASRNRLSVISNEEKIRATIRGALNNDKKEADITDSTFLGMANTNTSKDMRNTDVSGTSSDKNNTKKSIRNQVECKSDGPNDNRYVEANQCTGDSNVNPVDDL